MTPLDHPTPEEALVALATANEDARAANLAWTRASENMERTHRAKCEADAVVARARQTVDYVAALLVAADTERNP